MTTAREVVRTSVEIVTGDGTADAYLARPEGEGPYPGVLLYMNALGIRPHIKSMADRIAAAGYVVLLPNLFYRHGRAPVFELPEFVDFGRQPELFERVGPVLDSLTPELAMRDAGAYLERLAGIPGVAPGPAAITGYCMGARLALLTAGTYPERVVAAAGFHGDSWRPTRRTVRTCWPTGSRPSCTSGTPTRTRRCPPRRSTDWGRPCRRRASAIGPRCTGARGTATRWPIRAPTTPPRTNGTGRHCSRCSNGPSEPERGHAEHRAGTEPLVPRMLTGPVGVDPRTETASAPSSCRAR